MRGMARACTRSSDVVCFICGAFVDMVRWDASRVGNASHHLQTNI